jgi:allophanate hydrolase
MFIETLQKRYATGLKVQALLAELHPKCAAAGPVWISLVDPARLAERAAELEALRAAGRAMPLFGIPFAVKDNIDVAGMRTSCACPAFAYAATETASVVRRLEEAGAILLGKTNMDQFATGLVGTRSPYGVCHSVFSDAHVSGGSSSGSAVAVASGLVAFALGTDTAGSGRLPAAFNNIIGLKPTKGLISTHGVVPACRTLDCVSIFAGSVEDATRVLRVAQGFDAKDAFSRHPSPPPGFDGASAFRFGVPEGISPEDEQAAVLHRATIARLLALGGEQVAFDFAPFAQAGALLYAGPFVAERLAALRARGFTDWDAMDPSVAAIIRGGERIGAAEAFAGIYALAEAARAAAPAWRDFDVMLLPTAPAHPRIDAVAADPLATNAKLGAYTNFVNLLDYAAIAVPAGLRADGLPYGITLVAPAFADAALGRLAGRLHAALPGATAGATGEALPAPSPELEPTEPTEPTGVLLAVVGAHLAGQPLNHQLTSRGARRVRQARTAPGYRLYALAGSEPEKPGLLRDAQGAGLIELEIWHLSIAAFGAFVAEVPPPLAIGSVLLEDGEQVKGFVCEPVGLAGAVDITAHGGWRNWRQKKNLLF